MTIKRALTALVAIFCASAAFATSFIVPSDEEMVRKSKMIVIGTVEGSFTQWGDQQSDAPIETVYEIRVQRAVKGGATLNSLIRVTSPGGQMDHYGVHVPGAADFVNGERVLLFLTPHKDHLEVTDMMLGKFRSATSSRGQRVLVRETDEEGEVEILGRRDGARDRLRTEAGFIRFIERAGAGVPAPEDYLVAPSQVTASPRNASGNLQVKPNAFQPPAERYTQMFNFPPLLGLKWDPALMASGLTMHRRTCAACDTIIGTDPVITGAFASWNNECGSTINLVLGSTVTTAAQATNAGCGICDQINVIEFNDPQSKVGGSWSGSGTIGITFIVFTDTISSPNFGTLLDADIVFQDGYTSTEASFPTAMTHETGHALGFRHSNASPTSPNDSANSCSSATEECTTTANSAIMFWQVTAGGVGFVLQLWDQHAAQAVYPGSSCAAVPAAPTGVNAVATTATSVLVTWNAVAGATSYEVYRRAAGGGYVLRLPSPTTNSFTDSATSNTAYLYRVRAVNAAGSSPDSGVNLATTVIFTDDALVAGTTVIKAVHLAQLRTAVNAVRDLADPLAPGVYTDAAVSGVIVKAVHINQLRTQLDEAMSALGLATGGYTDVLSAGVSIKAVHFQELRNRVK